MKKDKKRKYVDDGHTVYNMDGVDEMRYGSNPKENVGLTRKERWAAIRAALAVFLPKFLLVLGCFAIVAILMYFWLM